MSGVRHLPPRQGSEPITILESFDRQTLARMEIALERACDFVSTGSQKHRSRRYIAKQIIACASNGDPSLDSLTIAAISAARQLNARRGQNSVQLRMIPALAG